MNFHLIYCPTNGEVYALWGVKTEDLEEDGPESWERDPNWWKETQ